MTNHTITIFTDPKPKPYRAIKNFAFIAAVISTGVVLDSSAMQWVGFALIWLAFLGQAIASVRRDSRLTISEARRRLDEIEREERA